MARYPALDVSGIDGDIALALADDYSPTAAEENGGNLTIFFSNAVQRDGARAAFARSFPSARLTSREVDDGDWARLSQEDLGPVTVGRVTVVPPWWVCSTMGDAAPPVLPAPADLPASSSLTPLRIVIRPSMAFGTGHHATTRLCLAGLQVLELSNRFVLDVGTGSGVLAIAARALGASEALGIDIDPDAIACATENLQLNEYLDRVTFEVADMVAGRLDTPAMMARPFHHRGLSADVITANLTGTLLCRLAPVLLDTLAPGGTLILSGLLAIERDEVVAAFAYPHLVWESREDEWLALAIRRRSDA